MIYNSYKPFCSSLFIKFLCPSTQYYFLFNFSSLFVLFLENVERNGLYLWKNYVIFYFIFSPISVDAEIYPNMS